MLVLNGKEINKASLAKMIDGSLLNPYTTTQEIDELVKISLEYNTNSVCVNPNYLERVAKQLKGTDVKACVVIDYPFGTGSIEDKVNQAKVAIEHGVEIVDFVIDYGHLKSGNKDHLLEEIKACVAAVNGLETRFIIEVCYLTPEEIVTACECVIEGGGDFVKTSTGRFGGPDMEIIDLLVKTCKGRCKLKVAGTGQFWTANIALMCIAAGVDIIGTRSAKKIVDALEIFERFVKGIEIK